MYKAKRLSGFTVKYIDVSRNECNEKTNENRLKSRDILSFNLWLLVFLFLVAIVRIGQEKEKITFHVSLTSSFISIVDNILFFFFP